jgi:dolichyl-phosphate beta-glucosyltransferase
MGSFQGEMAGARRTTIAFSSDVGKIVALLAHGGLRERDCGGCARRLLFAASCLVASILIPSAVKNHVNSDTVIVVPCYNEAARLDTAAFAAFLAQSCDVSFVMVDDGSSDGTGDVLEHLRACDPRRIAVLGLGDNVGKAEAVRRGVKLALRRAPSLVGYWDADLATPLSSIERFRATLAERPELLLVMGSRVGLLGRQIERTWKRHFMGRAFATAASLVLRLAVYDTQCGAKLFRVTPQMASLFDRPFRTRWIFDVEILARMMSGGPCNDERSAADVIYEYPLERWQDVAGSRLKPRDFLVAAADLAMIHWQYSRRSSTSRASRESAAPVFEPQPLSRKAA